MLSPITISIYHKGRQKDYEAIFTDNHSSYEFKVLIGNNIVNFVGSLQEFFLVKTRDNFTTQQLDLSVLEAVSRQLDQIFF